jgi:predicted PurR-regulated permease PerM
VGRDDHRRDVAAPPDAEKWLGGRRSLAVALMTIVLLLVLVIPFYFGVTAIVDNAGRIVALVEVAGEAVGPAARPAGSPPCRSSVRASRPAGSRSRTRARRRSRRASRLFARGLGVWLVARVGGLGLLLLQLLLTVVIVAILYANGETVARGADRFRAPARRGRAARTRCISPRARSARWRSA